MKELKFNIQLFAGNLNVQTTLLHDTVGKNDLSPTMKTFYKTSLLENARLEHFYNQFGQKQPLPKNNGKNVEWRKFDTYAPAVKPLTEGVTPDGNKVNIVKIEKAIDQYGDYTTISDRLQMEAVDPIVMSVTEEHGAQAGDTLEILTRNELMACGNKFTPGGKAVSQVGATDTITSTLVNQAATFLKKQHTPTINGDYICIVNPSVAMDLRESSGWLEAHKYAQPEEIYNGEIGKLHGVRFIETTFAPVVKANESAPAIYHSFMFGKDAYGIIEPSAESLEIIVKQLGSAGTADPLSQRSSVGWKASHAATLLYKERICDMITGSSFSTVDEDNYSDTLVTE